MADDRQLAEAFFNTVCEWSTEVRSEVLVFHDGEWGKDRELHAAIKSATFENLILRAGLREEIQEDFAQFFCSREVFEQYGIPGNAECCWSGLLETARRTQSRLW